MTNEDFKAITTQEEFDKAIAKRLLQKDREIAEKYRDYLSPDKVDALKEDLGKKLEEANAALKAANEKIAGHEKETAALTTRALTAETSLLKSRIASKHKIPIELADRLTGDTEEAIEKDAESFAGFMGPASAPPQYTHDSLGGVNNPQAASQAAYASLLASLSAND